jgi:uncharacterized protein YggE
MGDNDDRRTTGQVVFKLDYKLLTIALIAIVLVMLYAWRPWEDSRAKDRTISATGQATLSAVPDKFVFSPVYEFKDVDKQAALASLTKKNSEITAKLKSLGVPDSKIKASSDSLNYANFTKPDPSPTYYSLRFTITIDNKDLAQKVQDYLVSTTPTGSASPMADFSDQKRRELESKARDNATKEARSKAEQSAKNLGFSLGAVKTVNDGAGFGQVMPMSKDMAASSTAGSTVSGTTLQPGENDLNYSVTVTYFVR